MTDNFTASLINIDELYWKGKAATETFLVAVPIFLVILILFGWFLSKRKSANKDHVNMIVSVLFAGVAFISLTGKTFAMCPVCTVAIGAGLGFSRILGIDDLITSIWMGGLVVSTIYWILSWLEKRKIKSTKATLITYIVMYALVFIPLWIGGTIGAKGNVFYGIDKVFLGLVVGSIFFLLGMVINNFIKSRNGGKAKFPFQKVVLPISFLWIATLIIYLIIYYA